MRVAILQPQTLVGGELRAALASSGLPLLDVVLVGAEGEHGSLCEYDGEPRVIHEWADDVLDGVDILFMCGDCDADALDRKGSTPSLILALEATRVSALWPLFTGEGQLVASGDQLALRIAHPIAGVTNRVLEAVSSVERPVRVDVLGFEPVSSHGSEGIDELHAQTVESLSFRPPPTACLGSRIAFDLHPVSPGDEQDEQIVQQLTELTGDSIAVRLTRVRAPVFLGVAIHLALAFEVEVECDSLRSALQSAEGVDCMVDEYAGPGAPPADASPDVVHVALLDDEPTECHRLWVVADYLRAGIVLPALAAAAAWLRVREGS